MPNSRRRKFSVKNHLCPPTEPKKTSRNGPRENLDIRHTQSHSVHKLHVESSDCFTVPILTTAIHEKDDEVGPSSYSFVTRVAMAKTVDQEVMARSSIIDFIELLSMSSDNTSLAKSVPIDLSPVAQQAIHSPKSRMARQDKPLAARRDKMRAHCVTVRSPKRKALPSRISVAVSALDLPEPARQESTCNIIQKASSGSLDDMCRICHGGEQLSVELGPLVSACECRGTVGRVHVKCLERWLTESSKSRCELCGTKYATKRVHKYGFPKALFMWVLSQNAKQLMVDSLGIMLMSPLAMLAAWLSGRTLAGLMTQEPHVTPWPLASTFVLACMTLVCYYCWIVSAATRHALGWWIWYRAQYEVRLELEPEEVCS